VKDEEVGLCTKVAFAICNGLSRIKLNELFTLDDNIKGTRGHSWKLAKFRCARDCCKYVSLIEQSSDGISWISGQLVLPASVRSRGA